jgi:alpha-beta hydrolase superfamily lysophospholipase
MIHNEFGWQTADGLNIFAQVWIPETEVKAVVCLVHGLGEHSGRYKQLPVDLTDSGFVLFAYDQRGHGQSEGKRGHTPSYEAYLNDITKLLLEANKRFPGKKLFLYGHSMGGNLVINYALRFPSSRISGVIATGPWLKLSRPLSPFMNKMAFFLNKYYPSFRTLHSIKSTDFSKLKLKTEDYEKDKYMHPWISARTFICIRDAGLWALNHASEFKFPILILHGGSDKVTSPESSKEFVSKVKTDCTLKIFDDLYHEIHNEPRRNEIFSTLIDWLDSHSK